jgi:hypothetical protein
MRDLFDFVLQEKRKKKKKQLNIAANTLLYYDEILYDYDEIDYKLFMQIMSVTSSN